MEDKFHSVVEYKIIILAYLQLHTLHRTNIVQQQLEKTYKKIDSKK